MKDSLNALSNVATVAKSARTKIFAIAMMAMFIGAIFAAACSVGVLSALPITPLSTSTPPVTTMKLMNGTPVVNGWNTTAVKMNLTAVPGDVDANDAIKGIWYRIDTYNNFTNAWVTGSWVNYSTSGKNVTIKTNATIKINFNASDYLENEVTQTKILNIDMRAPVTTATITAGTAGDNGWYKSKVNFTVKADNLVEVNQSGLLNTKYKIGAAALATVTYVNMTDMAAGKKLNVSAQGSTLVEFYSTDNASNVEVTKNITIKIDSVAPTLALTQTNGSTITTRNITWTATDATSGVDHYLVSVDGGAAVTVAGTANGTELAASITNAQHNITVTAVDAAGNSVSKTVTLTVNIAAVGTDYTMYIIIIVVIIVIVVVAVLMMRRGKGKAAEAPATEEKQA